MRLALALIEGLELMSRWKKVVTNVSNFIMGNPIIDHYGDLVVSE